MFGARAPGSGELMNRYSWPTRWGWIRVAGWVAAATLLGGAAAPTVLAPDVEGAAGEKAKKSPRGFNRATILTIDGEINDVMSKSLDRRIEQAREQDTRLIVFELNTPGGSVSSSLDICATIKRLPREIHTVAWVKPHAFSAGSMIALACKEIVVSPYSQIGDCQPIMIGPQGVQAIPDEVRAKFSAPVLTEFRDSARKRGYDQLLCLAMIQPHIEVFWVENRKTDQRRFVDRAERDRLFGIERTKAPEARTKETVTKRKIQGEDVEERQREIVRQAGGLREAVESKTDWQAVNHVGDFIVDKDPVVAADELLTMTQDEAIAYGFARAKVGDEKQLIELYDIVGPVDRAEFNWSEQLVNWLTNPIVRGILMVLVMLGAYVEFNTPGVGVPGLVALICLVIFLGAPYLTGLANVWEIILVLIGVVLLGVEVLVIPGFGIAGIAGIVLVLVGLIATFVPDEPGPLTLPQFDYTWQGLGIGVKVLASAMVASLAGAIVLSHFFPKVPYVGRIVALNPSPAEVAMPEAYPRSAFLGDVGKTEGPLRPTGKARFGDTLVDVVSQSDYINAGEPVEVIERRGNRIVVRRVRDA